MREIVFELCAETIDACLAAKHGGADRIELCSGLTEGGLTPSHGLICAAVELSGLPIHVLVRPRGGDFFYSPLEIEVLREDILHLKGLGVAGVVLGILSADGTVDIESTRALVQIARPLQVTFHRAFDSTPSLEKALEDVVATGCDRVLTSGGHRDVEAGAAVLSRLVQQANGRIDVALGGGLRLQNAESLVRLTNARHFHGSLLGSQGGNGYSPSGSESTDPSPDEDGHNRVDADAVRSIIHKLQNA